METKSGVDPGGICDRTAQTRGIEIQPSDGTGREPEVLVELVVIGGAEGEELHAIQAEVVRRILTRLAETQKDTKERSL
jgi:hypothetical protein